MLFSLKGAITVGQLFDFLFIAGKGRELSTQRSTDSGDPLGVSWSGAAAFESVADAFQEKTDGID